MAKREFATLAHSLDPKRNMLGWMLSRKLNGWGCLWDGGVTTGMLADDVPWYYKGGDKSPVYSTGLWTIGRENKPKVINAPAGFIETLPKEIPLQGELWRDDDLQYIKKVCGQGIKGRSDSRWGNVQFCVYNVKPYSEWQGIGKLNEKLLNGAFGRNQTWATRLGVAKMLTNKDEHRVGETKEPWFFLEQEKVTQLAEIMLRKTDVLHYGWEGLVFTNPRAHYESKRSHNLLKWKPEFDAEAEVVGYKEGQTGKNIGRLGAVLCRLTWNEQVSTFTGGRRNFVGKTVTFGVSGWSDNEREWFWIKEAYPIGSTLHFTFSGVSENGVPTSCNRVAE